MNEQGILSPISSLFLLFLHYHYPVHLSPTQFPLISLPDDPFHPILTGYLCNLYTYFPIIYCRHSSPAFSFTPLPSGCFSV